MQRRHWYQLLAICALSLTIRYAAIDLVGIWRDHGFYAYDTRLILEGKRPFIDFLGRSPLFLYALAAWRAMVGYSPASFRIFISVIWTATALPVYGLARYATDHRSALVASGAAVLLPYGVVYGLWANTMSLAVLAYLTALWLVVCRDSTPAWGVAGIMLSLAFLSRRSVVMLVPAIVTYLFIRQRAGAYSLRDSVRRLGSITLAGALSLAGGYLVLAYGDVYTAWALFDVHTLNLFISTGRGGWPLLGASVDHVGNSISTGRIPVLNAVCQLCGRWTARTLAKGLLVAVPAASIVAGIGLERVKTSLLDERLVPYLTAPLLALAGWAVMLSVVAGYWLRVGAVISMVGIAVLAFRQPVSAGKLRDRPALLVSICTVAFMVTGYLYRERLLHVYYGMDLWPLLSLLAGVGTVALWRSGQRPVRVALTVFLTIAIVTSGAAAFPLANVVVDGNSAGWHTPELMDRYQEDINERTEPGDVVLTQSATYLAGTHARMPLDDSRSTGHFYSTFSTRGGQPLRRTYANLSDGMANGDVALVIESGVISDMIANNQTISRLFKQNYCRVQDQDVQRLYNQTHAVLHTYCG